MTTYRSTKAFRLDGGQTPSATVNIDDVSSVEVEWKTLVVHLVGGQTVKHAYSTKGDAEGARDRLTKLMDAVYAPEDT